MVHLLENPEKRGSRNGKMRLLRMVNNEITTQSRERSERVNVSVCVVLRMNE